MSEHLSLKWGTLKSWQVETEASKAALQKYFDGGVCMSAIFQRDTQEQKQAICELIDAIDGEIINEWSGEVMSKDDAKTYVIEYITPE